MDTILDFVGHQTDLSRFVLLGTLLMMRAIPVTFLTPFLGGKLVPPETRVALALGMTVLSFQYAESYMAGPLTPNPLVYIVLMFKELFIGFVIGFLAVKIFYAMEYGGRMLDTLRGSNMAEAQVPELGFRASPMGDFLFHLLLVVYMGIDGHVFFIESVVESFRVVPVDAFPGFAGSFEEWMGQFLHYSSALFGIAFALTFPGMFASFMTDIVFGMLNRVAPQLNAYSLAMGIKALAGIAFFFFSMSLLVKQLGVHSRNTVMFLQRIIDLLG